MHDRTRGDAGVDGANVVSGAYSSAFSAEAHDGVVARDDEVGFSGSCTATLIDWIQLVQLGRRDAVLAVLSHDGGHATLWCREGDIVDAECDGAVGEDAVFRALSWKSGRVYVELDGGVARPPRITTSTSGLLLRAAYRRDSGVHEIAADAGTGGDDGTAVAFDLGNDPTEVSAPAQLPPFADSRLDDPRAEPRSSLSLRFVVAGSLSVILLFLALFMAFVRISGPPSPAEPAAASSPGRIPPAAAVAIATPARPTVIPASRSARAVQASNLASASATAPAPTPPPVLRKPAPAPSPSAKGVPAHHRAPVALAKRTLATPPGALLADQPRSVRARALASPPPIKLDVIANPPSATPPQVEIIGRTEGRAQPRIQIIEDRKPRIQRVE